jgi:hypothetical protein
MSGSKRVMVGWLMLTVGAWGQATFPSPVLTSISPLGGQRGTVVDLTVKGTHLDGPLSLLLAPGVAVKTTPKLDAKGLPVANQLQVEIPAEAAPGVYELRVVGRYGISNPRVFQIGSQPQVSSPGTNTRASSALKVAVDQAIEGVFKTAAPHWFVFEGQAGQRVLGAFKGEAFDTRLTLTGAVLDQAGREVAKLRDGLLDVVLPEAGEYRLKLHDLMFGTGDDFGYRLTLTTGPLVWAVGNGVAYGWNLPGGAVIQGLTVGPITALEKLVAAPAEIAALVARSPLLAVDLSGETEAADAVASEQPTALAVGQSHAGWFPAWGGMRSFDLAFKNGDRFVIELVSSELGFPTDPVLLIENVKPGADGAETVTPQAEVNDPAGLVPVPTVPMILRDPSYAFEAKADGIFRVSISDPLNAANGRRYPYALQVKPLTEKAMTAGLAMHPTLPRAAVTGPYEMASANVWRGGVTAVEVVFPFRVAQSEPLALALEDLPAGVTCLGGFVGKNQRLGYVVLQAGKEAAAGAGLLKGVGRARHLNWPARDSNRERLMSREGRSVALGVVAEDAPGWVEVAAGGVFEVAVGGKLEIPVTLHRHAAFTEAVTLKPLGLVDLTKAPTLVVAAKATEGKLSLDTKSLALAAGEYGFVLQGAAKMPFRSNGAQIAEAEAAAKQASEAVTTAKKSLDEAAAAAKQVAAEDAEGLAAAQAKLKEATDQHAAAGKAATAAAAAAKALVDKNPAKDATFLVYSTPVRVTVKEAAKP